MATQFEKVFIQHLTISESMEKIVEMGVSPDVFVDHELKAIYSFALQYWHQDHSGGIAPSSDALKTHFSNVLAEHEIDVEYEPEDSLEWSVEALRGSFIDRQWQSWVRDFATDMSGADILDKPEVLTEALDRLMGIQTAMSRKTEQVDIRDGMSDRLTEYLRRESERGNNVVRGIPFGMEQIDSHTNGILPGELCILAAGPKTGKSFMLLYSALKYWKAGGVPVLFTLENSVEMTQDRLACMELGIDARRWNRGECDEGELQRIREWTDALRNSERPFWILQPEPGKRTVDLMIRQARVLGNAAFIDQLTFVDVPKASDRSPRHIQIRDILHDLKSIISSGNRIPCLMAHQINREGVKSAERSGKLEMYHLAESAEVERTADWVFGLWQGEGLRQAGRAYIQMLAARREDLVDWEAVWRPHIGQIAVRGQVDLSQV